MATMSISRAITHHATQRPHDPALTCGDVTLSWQEFDRSHQPTRPCVRGARRAADDLVTIALPNSHGVLRVRVRNVETGRHPAARVGQAARPRAGGDRRAGRFEARGRRRRDTVPAPCHRVPSGFDARPRSRRRRASRHRQHVTGRRRRPAAAPVARRSSWPPTPGVFDPERAGFGLPDQSACVIPGRALSQRSVLDLVAGAGRRQPRRELPAVRPRARARRRHRAPTEVPVPRADDDGPDLEAARGGARRRRHVVARGRRPHGGAVPAVAEGGVDPLGRPRRAVRAVRRHRGAGDHLDHRAASGWSTAARSAGRSSGG